MSNSYVELIEEDFMSEKYPSLKKLLVLFLLFSFWFFPLLTSGQSENNQSGYTISGKVIDTSTGEPLPFCNIYFSQSLKGATSDVNGNFVLSDVLSGDYDLITSFIGFTTYRTRISITDADINNFTIKLNPDIQSLESIEVVGKRDKEWERKLKQFEKIILGQTGFSKQCEIKNPWIISFSGDKNSFTATANQSIEIENNALGFLVKLDLNRFQKFKEVFEFNGYFHFSQLQARSAADLERWKLNRLTAYNGSLPHFFKTAIKGDWRESGYTVESVSQALGNQKIKPDVRPNGDEWLFYSNGLTQINYHHEYHEGESQASMIASRTNRPIRLTSKGIPKDPTSFAISGYLSLEGVSTLLPLEYLQFEEEFFKQTAIDTEVASTFNTAFTKYGEWNPEKLFVRTDKESYYSGETIWMRTYLMNAISHLPVNVPTKVHLQLLNEKGETLIHHRLNSINGGASANFNLADTLDHGNYLIKAFTDLMDTVNSGPFFQRPIQVTGFIEDPPVKKDPDPLLQFFPEGGDLIEGITSTVGFKYNRTSFIGTLYEDGRELQQISPVHNGMGSFQIQPIKGKRYYVAIEGVNNEFDLPRAKSDGATISARMAEGSIDVQVNMTQGYKKADLYLLVHNGGQIVYFKSINSSRSEIPMDISWNDLKPGINHVTLFDFVKRPLAERLIYKALESEKTIEVSLSKSDYSSREKVNLEFSSLLESKDTLYTDLSVSVIDLSQADQASGIFSYVNFISDLGVKLPTTQGAFPFEKDFLEYPNLYTLIHSWRRFSWQDFLINPFDSIELKIPGIAIKGSVVRANGRPYKEINVNLFNRSTSSVYTSEIRRDGSFVFNGLDVQTTDDLVLSISNPNGKVTNPIVKIDSSAILYDDYHWNSLIGYNPVDNKKDEADELALERTLSFNLDDFRLLDEVEINTVRIEEDQDGRKQALGKGTYSIKAEEIVGNESFQHIFDYIRSAPGVMVVRGHRGLNPLDQYVMIRGPKTFKAGQFAQILVDNLPIPAEQIKAISPQDIESVEIYSGTKASAYGARGAQGIVAFYTKRAQASDPKESDQFIKSFTYKNAFYTPNTFQHPDYSVMKVNDDYKDLRSTVYWNPNVSFTNFDGANLSFYTSDRATDLLIDIQGITQNGKLVHERKVISVK